jgi:hypothetical protein
MNFGFRPPKLPIAFPEGTGSLVAGWTLHPQDTAAFARRKPKVVVRARRGRNAVHSSIASRPPYASLPPTYHPAPDIA